MTKLYRKSELWFALAWIGVYVIGMNIALQFADGFDNLAGKTVEQLLVPVGIGLLLAVVATVWIVRSGLTKHFGLCAFRGDWRGFLFFLPLLLVSLTNFTNGVALEAALILTVLMALNKALAGYVEEIIFRGFLFRAMARENLTRAIIVSAVTFGAGHIVNLANTEDVLSVLLQVGYAIAIGFLYTVIVWKGGSLWPCIISHMLVNASSSFSAQRGPFTRLTEAIFGQATPEMVQTFSAVLLIVVSGAYTLWIWKKAGDAPAAE